LGRKRFTSFNVNESNAAVLESVCRASEASTTDAEKFNDLSQCSHTPAARHQINTRQNAGSQPHYILESMGEVRRDENRVRSSGRRA
jgi:hypothetical protein